MGQLKSGFMKYCDCCHIEEIEEKRVPLYEDKFYWYSPFIGVYILKPGDFVELEVCHEISDDYGVTFKRFSSSKFPEKPKHLGQHQEVNTGEGKIGLVSSGHYCRGFNVGSV